MRKKITVSRKDYGRVLLTELLPYEVPLIFSNEGLYRLQKIEKKDWPPLIKTIFDIGSYTVPLDYAIRQGVDRTRHLSLIHPGWQLKYSEFYRDYESILLHLCQRSSFSLRHPSRVATYYKESEYEAAHSEINSGLADTEPTSEQEPDVKYAGSYFHYSRYNQLYKFYESSEFLELERQFPYLLKFDLKRCFSSIYTHTISWAVKGKEFAKSLDNRGFSFDCRFDSIMQGANHKETNGIVVGPEISRIFAEVILQDIDLSADTRLRLEHQNVSGRFAVRRYVDDYFVFSDSPQTGMLVKSVLEEELRGYKLYINEEKTVTHSRPFATIQTIAKTGAKKLLETTVLKWLRETREFCIPREPETAANTTRRVPHVTQKAARSVIRDLKVILKDSGASFDHLSGYVLGALGKATFRFEKNIRERVVNEKEVDAILTTLLAMTEVVFFLYAMDFRVRTTYSVAQFMVSASKIAKVNGRLARTIDSELSQQILNILRTKVQSKAGGIEVLAMLNVLKMLSPNGLSQDDVLRFTGAATSSGTDYRHYSYFDMISVLHYVGDSPAYESIRTAIEREALFRMEASDSEVFRSCERSILLIDMVACPHVSRSTKEKLISAFWLKAKNAIPNGSDVGQLINFVQKQKVGFTDWRADLNIEKLLVKKQLKPGY